MLDSVRVKDWESAKKSWLRVHQIQYVSSSGLKKQEYKVIQAFKTNQVNRTNIEETSEIRDLEVIDEHHLLNQFIRKQ